MSSYIMSVQLFEKNWINSKLFSETLAGAISSVSSSFSDVSLKIYVGKECDVNLLGGKVKTTIKNEAYESSIIFQNSVTMKDSSSTCETGYIIIKKINDEVWVE